jgi:Mg-chelatase subunit ChlI
VQVHARARAAPAPTAHRDGARLRAQRRPDRKKTRREDESSSIYHDSAFSEDSAKARLASSLATEIRDAPFLTIPLGATEDAVLGSVDIERSAATGEAAFSPGILARANRGVLFFDDANLLDDAVVDAALRATDAGYNAVGARGHIHRASL